MSDAVLAIDQGTTRTKAVVFDAAGRPLAESSSAIELQYPHPGWVEADAAALYASIVENGRSALQRVGTPVRALGLANQGETVVVWNRHTGDPVYPAIVWQDRRTDAYCAELVRNGSAALIQERTCLPVDPYFSATKLHWILQNVPEAHAAADRGDLLAGTTDVYFLWRLTGRHHTDHSTASRTMLYNPRTRGWDQEVLRLLDIPEHLLPDIRRTVDDFGTTDTAAMGRALPIKASVVDQQAALFGQACYSPGDVKVTYGTGAFILLNTGESLPCSQHGLLPTVAWSIGDRIIYALDGGIYVAGAAVQWLCEGLGIMTDAAESAEIAASVPDTGGVMFVPALSGLAAPYWDSSARGTILGITRGTTRAHIVRAALEGIAFRTRDVLDAMSADVGYRIRRIKVDGGASANSFLMQTLADLVAVEVQVAALAETTALGVAFLAGIGAGIWDGEDALSSVWKPGRSYCPHPIAAREEQYAQWKRAVERARGWAEVTPE